MSYLIIMTVLTAHWFADFVLQTDWQAKNKSTNNKALVAHVGSYTAVMLVLGVTILPPVIGIAWALFNGFLHLHTDYVTSRINSRLWSAGKVHYFFVSVGFDQLIHYACLFGTLGLIWGLV